MSSYTVEKTFGREIGEFYTFKNSNKSTPYTQGVREFKNIPLLETDVVVDIGAYVGEFSIYALKKGVKTVKSFEPTPSSYEVLKTNLAPYKNAEIFNAAVVGDDSKSVTFSLSSGNGTRNKIGDDGKRSTITVPAIQYSEAIKDATVIKMDVEGAEWTYPILENISPNLRGLVIEFHPSNEEHREITKNLCSKLSEMGFETVFPVAEDVEAAFWERYDKHGKTWSAHRAWLRKE